MRWNQLQQIIRDQPIFETTLLLAGEVTPHQIQRQLSDWSQSKKLIQLRRGVYALPDKNPHPFIVANQLLPGSYVSLQTALAHYHLIPEHVAIITSVTTQRPGKWQNKFGRFTYRHISQFMFFGVTYRLLVGDEYAYLATPEKALLDLIYFRPQGDSTEYIESLRLQNLEILDLDRLNMFAGRSGKPKLRRAAAIIEKIARRELEEFEPL